MNEVVIEKIQFLTPAVVTYTRNGVREHCEVSVDCKDRTVVVQPTTPPEIARMFFPFLDKSLSMSPNSYEADEEIYDEANRASSKFEETRREYVGEPDV